jgi:DNA segregation ATPase FtsK/SpoIIIE, S-DNA-T family
MAHLCSTYICGIDDRALDAGAALIGWGLAEAERRAARVRTFKAAGLAPEGKVTPELAARPRSGLHPVCIVIDEAHELFLHDKAIAGSCERLIKRGRALGIIIVLATQIPDAKSVPPNITRCVTVRWCMAVQDQVANDMILGTGAYKRGLSAAVYRPGVDAGWGVAIGLEQPGPVRSHYPDPQGTKALIGRATALRGGVVGSDDETPRQRRDILADVREVFRRTRAKRLHHEPLLAHLIEWWPEAYSGWTVAMLGEAMRAAGVPVGDVKVAGITRKGVKVEAVEAAIDARQLPAR